MVESKWKHVVADTETDGFVDTLTRIHCLVLRDVETEEVMSCTDDGDPAVYHTIDHGLGMLERADRVYFHNGTDFDVPAITKVYPSFKLREDVVRDTLVMARHRWAHIKETDYARAKRGTLPGKLIGSHSLKAWGYRLGILKGDFGDTTDWSVWTPEMQTYCEGDTGVTLALVNRIRSAGVVAQAIETEHELAGYLAAQRRNGVPFDQKAAVDLLGTLTERRQVLSADLITEFGWWYKHTKPFTPKADSKRYGYTAGAELCKLERVEFNPTSRPHIADRLKTLYGWKPSEFTESGQVKIDDDMLTGLTQYPACAKLKEYLTLDKRIGQISEGKQAWLKVTTPDGLSGGKVTGLTHIHGSVNQSGCVTHRATHSYPNLAQVPSVSSPFGPECRALFGVRNLSHWYMMGADASGLELRCLAHYMAKYDNGEYVNVVLHGDVHTVNQHAAGLATRAEAKTFIYAFLYGAGDELLGAFLCPNGTEAQKTKAGKALRAKFLKGLPAMSYLTTAVKQAAKQRKYLKLIDGRRAFVRSEHAALNVLLQGTGAVICKRWIVEFNRRMRAEFGEQGWKNDWAAMLWIHDEIQIAVRDTIADKVPPIAIASIEAMTEHFNFRCSLTGEAKLGKTWADTH